MLGPPFDHTHRPLGFHLAADGPPARAAEADDAPVPPAAGILDREGVLQAEPAGAPVPPDLTRAPPELPAGPALRLQALARGDEGFLLALAYSTQRG